MQSIDLYTIEWKSGQLELFSNQLVSDVSPKIADWGMQWMEQSHRKNVQNQC